MVLSSGLIHRSYLRKEKKLTNLSTNLVKQARMLGTILHSRIPYGEKDYEYHLQAVHDVLIRYNVGDIDLLACAWLHDALEDTVLKYKHLKEFFGERIADIVEAVTLESGKNRKEKYERTYPKIRRLPLTAVPLKLADRIANVEYGKSVGSSMVDMYRREQPVFEYSLRSGEWEGMWDHLNSLFK